MMQGGIEDAEREVRAVKGKKQNERKSRLLTPELIVVAAALRLPAAVSGLADVALVVNTFTVQ